MAHRGNAAVCDASVAINFAKIRRLDLLFGAFDAPLLMPQEVFAEAVETGLASKAPDARLIEAGVQNGLIAVKKVRAPFPHPYLDSGEKAVISLALQEKVRTVCFDEAPARNAATQAGLKPIGSLGVLARAVKAGKLRPEDASEILDEMVRRDYRISAKILEAFKRALEDGAKGRL